MNNLAACSFGLALLSAAAAHAAPFQNGSIESGTLVNTASFDELHIGSTAITGWTVLGPAGVDYIENYWVSADGLRSLDLVGCDRAGGGQGGVEQTFDTVPGAIYQVTFSMAGNFGNTPAIKSLLVSAAGQSAAHTFDTTGKSSVAMGWESRYFTFAATSTSTTLRFENTSNGSTCAGAAIDNVVVGLRPAVPVQDAAWGAALAIALAVLFGLHSRRRRDDLRA